MTCIVFLKDIKIEDYRDIEDEFTDRLLQEVSVNDTYKVETHLKYDIIPPIFESLETWPKVNNIRCWTCDFTFTSIPVFIPLNIKQNDDKWNISVLGNFCSFNCACRHIVDYMNKDLLNNLIKLYSLFHNTEVCKIEPTPRRHIMEKYGGYMPEEQFLSQIKKISLSIVQNDNIKKLYIQEYQFNNEFSSEDEN